MRVAFYFVAVLPCAAFLQIVMFAYSLALAVPLAAGVWLFRLDASECWGVWRLFAFGPARLFLRGLDNVKASA